jgi:disulfide bond formation protein DsbB
MDLVHGVIFLMALGIAALNAALVLAVLAYCSPTWRPTVRALVGQYGRLAIFLFALGSIGGSLFIQYFASLPPCWLCWWQRIFMYPSVIIAVIAIIKQTDLSDIADYILVMSFFGALVSLYQHLLQVMPAGTIIPCDATGDCAVRSIFELGYITTPWMALSVFAVFVFITLVGRRKA